MGPLLAALAIATPRCPAIPILALQLALPTHAAKRKRGASYLLAVRGGPHRGVWENPDYALEHPAWRTRAHGVSGCHAKGYGDSDDDFAEALEFAAGYRVPTAHHPSQITHVPSEFLDHPATLIYAPHLYTGTSPLPLYVQIFQAADSPQPTPAPAIHPTTTEGFFFSPPAGGGLTPTQSAEISSNTADEYRLFEGRDAAMRARQADRDARRYLALAAANAQAPSPGPTSPESSTTSESSELDDGAPPRRDHGRSVVWAPLSGKARVRARRDSPQKGGNGAAQPGTSGTNPAPLDTATHGAIIPPSEHTEMPHPEPRVKTEPPGTTSTETGSPATSLPTATDLIPAHDPSMPGAALLHASAHAGRSWLIDAHGHLNPKPPILLLVSMLLPLFCPPGHTTSARTILNIGVILSAFPPQPPQDGVHVNALISFRAFARRVLLRLGGRPSLLEMAAAIANFLGTHTINIQSLVQE